MGNNYWIIRGRFITPVGAIWFWADFISDRRTQREAARTAPNFSQPINLVYGTCASARFFRHSAGAWLYAHCVK